MRFGPLPPTTTRLVLVRHGEPAAEIHGRCYGRLDVPLSPRGREQAERTARWLSDTPLDAIYASPLERARASAAPLARSRALEVRPADGLRELDFGELEGLTHDEARLRHPEIYAAWMATPTEVTFPGGESYALLRSRVLAEVRRIAEVHDGRTVALVAHGGPIRVILGAALGLADANVFRLDQGYAAVSVVDYAAGAAIVRLVNGSP